MNRRPYLAAALVLTGAFPVAADEVPRLPGTAPLTWQGDLPDRMMDGLHAFVEGKVARSVDERPRYWKRDTSSAAAYEKSVEPNRRRFRKVIGVVDERLLARVERFGDDDAPALVAETGRYPAWQVRWPALDGVSGEGLLLEPKGKPLADVVALPDADHTPEQVTGLAPGVAKEAHFARRLAGGGFPWKMPYFDMGSTFNYAELAALMLPWPFMVERGHQDGVAPDEWVAYECAKVRRLYDRLGLGGRTAVEFFDGPHTIHGRGTFDFLHRHLSWPKR